MRLRLALNLSTATGAWTAIALIASCGADHPQGDRPRIPSAAIKSAVDKSSDGQRVKFSGELNEHSVAQAKVLIDQHVRILEINSLGGEILPAISLGRYLYERRVAVEVTGACLSACAHFVFAPAREKRLREGSLVGFHGTALARYTLLSISGRSDLASGYRSIADAERAFYAQVGLNQSLLIIPLERISPACYIEDRTAPLGSDLRGLIATRTSFYVPSLSSLSSWGVRRIVGEWPSNEDELAAAVAKLPKHGLSFTLDRPSGSQIVQLQALPQC